MDAANNRLYILDDIAHRALIYEFLENTTATPASGSVDDLYSAPLTATGTEGTLSFSVASGSLPPGLSIVSSDIVGTPTTEGTYEFTLRAIDTFGVSTFVDDLDLSITIGPAGSTGGGGGRQTPEEIGFFPDRIVINDDSAFVDGYNVLVTVYAHFSEDFSGTIDVLLSNSPSFQTTIPFRYVVEDGDSQRWERTMAWDLCFGLPENRPCEAGRKTVYARFYVNQEQIRPALTPLASPPTKP